MNYSANFITCIGDSLFVALPLFLGVLIGFIYSLVQVRKDKTYSEEDLAFNRDRFLGSIFYHYFLEDVKRPQSDNNSKNIYKIKWKRFIVLFGVAVLIGLDRIRSTIEGCSEYWYRYFMY